ncbi:M15 family metallopeptidase [Streptococcus catagoni]|uniref:M15 family metallopeptidase n=1 Tax=Streptococcus catagoni TaxID=2654874 RepID=UPI00140E46AF|nr:D-alanyl-D-alanine carboxypeptidase family protein [Streptococcus catagoni]
MKNNKLLAILLKFLVVLLFLFCLYYFVKGDQALSQTSKNQQTKVLSSQSTKSKESALPKVSAGDWQLVLVNKDHHKDEMNPKLVDINGIKVNAKIENETAEFLAAAQTIDPQEHLILGYRSVEEQASLYQSYVDQEKAKAPNLTQKAAEALVQGYFQAPGTSEHQTGLAIEMSTVDTLNQSDSKVVEKIKKIAPDYGFVLRFPEDKKDSTGVNYRDWHYRYVGKKSAKYMTENNLSLEEYVGLLKEKR